MLAYFNETSVLSDKCNRENLQHSESPFHEKDSGFPTQINY